mmetsp:Transcript_123367/g.308172  ORF Transcript_123367/g.308172 Transcript_123367/m.308172 type:complete len:204 (+) Transcript_123367:73-684(+)
MAASFLPQWWSALRIRHSVLGIFESAYKKERQAFNAKERGLCLGMGLGCTWISVFVKHAVHTTREDMLELPAGLGGHLDSLICGVVASVLNIFIGKSLVKKVLSKDWDDQPGFKAKVSTLAAVWASLLTCGTLAHAVYFGFDRPTEVASKVFGKWTHSVVMHLAVAEPVNIGMAIAIPMLWASLVRKMKGGDASGDLTRPLLS